MDSLIGLVGALAPDHVKHHAHEVMDAHDGGDVEVKCGCGVRLTFLAAQISAIAAPSAVNPSPETSAKGDRDGS